MSEIIKNELDEFKRWREENLKKLNSLTQWLREKELLSKEVKPLLSPLKTHLKSKNINVAFIAEFSRGKSELINAIFFASGGRRILPASIGRTTMCSVEIMHDAKRPPSIRLLPLSTQFKDYSLTECIEEHEEFWLEKPLDIDDIDQLTQTISTVSDRRVTNKSEARELGLIDEADATEDPAALRLEMIEVPKWRHAIINYAHPLLKRGISILDTPGLNSVGVELELTLSLLPQAHVVFFVLSADTGVTRSDLQIWNDYLTNAEDPERPTYVLLNKIDVLWDSLLTEQEAQEMIDQQRNTCAKLLGIPVERVLAISAQKGLVGKIQNDYELLQKSHLLDIERLLVRDILHKRQEILQQLLDAKLERIQTAIMHTLKGKMRRLDQNLDEFVALNSKNTSLIKEITKNLIERQELLSSLQKEISAMRTVEKKALKRVATIMQQRAIDEDLQELSTALNDSGLKMGISNIFERTMVALTSRAKSAEEAIYHFEDLVSNHMLALESDYGLTLSTQPSPGIGRLISDLETLKNRHKVFFNVNQMMRLQQPQYTSQVFKTLLTRAHSVFDEAYDELDTWSKNTYNLLVVQVQELQDSIDSLYAGVEQVQTAREPLHDRIDEIEDQRLQIFQLQSDFAKIMLGFERFSKQYGSLAEKLSMPIGEAQTESTEET